VLKITIIDFSDEQRWSLDGRLEGPWAGELRSTWRKTRRQDDTRRCIVELNNVAFIDQTGEAALAEIMGQGAEFIAGGVYTQHRLRDIRRKSKRGRMKKSKEYETDKRRLS
jgi:hypothetical protein